MPPEKLGSAPLWDEGLRAQCSVLIPGNGSVDPAQSARAGCRDAAEPCAIPRRRSYPRGRRRHKYCNETNSYRFCSVQAGGGSLGGKDIAADAEVGRVESYVDAG